MLHPGSNVTFQSRLHDLKQDGQIVSIDDGIQIDSSDTQDPNASSPRVRTLEPHSNVKTDNLVHEQKQPAQIVSMDEGIQID
jgi:hypothetical protein